MLIEFKIKNNLYEKLENAFYGTEISNPIIYNFVPVKVFNEHWILTCSKNLEGYLIEYRENIRARLYFNNSSQTKLLQINSIISTTDEHFNSSTKYDCYVDIMSGLILIRYDSDELIYNDIGSLDLNVHDDLDECSSIKQIKYVWTNNKLKEMSIIKTTELKFVWDEKYINLPQVPYLIDVTSINSELVPISGCGIFQINQFDNVIKLTKLIGIVMYASNEQIIITPLMSIKRMFKQLDGYHILSLGIDLFPVNFNFKSEFNKINYEYGLIVGNKFYDDRTKSKKNKKNFNRKSLNISNNNHSNNHNDNNDNNNNDNNNNDDNNNNECVDKNTKDNLAHIKKNSNQPKKSNERNSIDDKYQLKNSYEISNEGNKIYHGTNNNPYYNMEDCSYYNMEKCLYSNTDDCSYSNTDNYSYSNTKDNEKYKFGNGYEVIHDNNLKKELGYLNENLSLDKNIKYLSRKNILCSFDNFKINFDGNIIISPSKTIPLKSYIWLFKTHSNLLELKYIPNHSYNINLIELNSDKITIDDTYIKKNVIVNETSIIINSNYNEISSFNTNEIKYIEYKNKLLIELNEDIMFLMKDYVRTKANLYASIFEKIFNFKYNNDNKKIIIGINLNDQILSLHLINGYKNFENITKINNTNKKLKKFIECYF